MRPLSPFTESLNLENVPAKPGVAGITQSHFLLLFLDHRFKAEGPQFACFYKVYTLYKEIDAAVTQLHLHHNHARSWGDLSVSLQLASTFKLTLLFL